MFYLRHKQVQSKHIQTTYYVFLKSEMAVWERAIRIVASMCDDTKTFCMQKNFLKAELSGYVNVRFGTDYANNIASWNILHSYGYQHGEPGS